MTITTAQPDNLTAQSTGDDGSSWTEAVPSQEGTSPFQAFEVGDAVAGGELATAYAERLVSPFSEAAGSITDGQLENEAVQALLAELEDEDFSESLEVLAQEAAARHAEALSGWSGETPGAAGLAGSEVARWLEDVAQEAEARLAALADRVGERTVESFDEAEWSALTADLPGSTSPVAAQEQFLKSLVNKVRKIGSGIATMAKKGLSTLSRFLPMGKLLDAVRRLVRPLVQRVLARAIGKLPASLQPAARQLAQRFGISSEVSEVDAESFEAEHLTDEFDRRLVGHLLAPEGVGAEAEAADYEAESRSGTDHVAALDTAREHLAGYFAEAEPNGDPTAQLEQFIPAVLPLVKLGISVVGRQRVVSMVARLIAQLIQPMVGRQLAPVLSNHLAGSGLALIGLEAESGQAEALGRDALVSVAEDTVREVFTADHESLETELVAAARVQEAFADAVTRHLPAEVLREELRDELRDSPEGERGVWISMPRGRAPYRFRVYSRRIPVLLQRAAARQIVLTDGETLEDRILDAGVERFPVQLELEAYETLPGGEVGHILGSERGGAAAETSAATSEFELLDEASRLNVLLPSRVAVPPAARRPQHGRRYVRIRAAGRPLRRRSPFSLRLDLTAATPVLTVRVRLDERRAHRMAERIDRRQHVAVIASFQRWVRGPMRVALGRRLHRVLTKRGIGATEAAAGAAGSRIADGLASAFAEQIVSVAPQLSTAAKDPQAGVTLAFAFTYPSRDALAAGKPGAPRLTVTPGWHRG